MTPDFNNHSNNYLAFDNLGNWKAVSGRLVPALGLSNGMSKFIDAL